MDLLLLNDALRRVAGEGAAVTLRLPYLPYARQDRVTVAGEPLSVKVFCTLINAMKFDRVVVADPHSTVAPALLDRVEIESAEGFLGQVLALPEFVGGVALVAPDAGAHKRVLALGERFGAPVVCCAKLRNTATGKLSGARVLDEVPDLPLLVVDDICDGGGTFVALAALLRRHSDRPLGLYVTHGLCTKGVAPLRDYARLYTAYPRDPRSGRRAATSSRPSTRRRRRPSRRESESTLNNPTQSSRTMSTLNPLTQIDFYKSGHIFQYPAGTESVYSNFTARSDRLAPVLRSGLAPFEGKVVFVGLQGFVKEFLIQAFDAGFFRLPKAQAVRQYRRRMDNALGPGAVPVDHIAALHDLGYLPVRIKALPEGSRVNIKVPLFTVRETRKEFAWLTNYLETVLSNFNWKPITVATIAHEYRRLLEAYADLTGADAAFIDWQAHDFSARGLSGPEDSMRAGFAHLCSFTGTDTVAAIDYAEQYYGADSDRELVGGSVPATEHSVMSMGGKLDEIGTFRRLITEVYPRASCPSCPTPGTSGRSSPSTPPR